MPPKRTVSKRVSNAAALAAELAPFTWQPPTSLALQQWLQEANVDCRIVNAEVAEVFLDWPHMLVTTSIGAIRKLVSELHGDTLHTMMVFRDKVRSHGSLGLTSPSGWPLACQPLA